MSSKNVMSATDLARHIAELTGVSIKDSKAVLDKFIEEVPNQVFSGKTIQMIGFGTFEAKHSQARTGRNPQTGEPMDIPAKESMHFKAAKAHKRNK